MKKIKKAQEIIQKFLDNPRSDIINMFEINELVKAGIKEIENLKTQKNDRSTNN